MRRSPGDSRPGPAVRPHPARPRPPAHVTFPLSRAAPPCACCMAARPPPAPPPPAPAAAPIAPAARNPPACRPIAHDAHAPARRSGLQAPCGRAWLRPACGRRGARKVQAVPVLAGASRRAVGARPMIRAGGGAATRSAPANPGAPSAVPPKPARRAPVGPRVRPCAAERTAGALRAGLSAPCSGRASPRGSGAERPRGRGTAAGRGGAGLSRRASRPPAPPGAGRRRSRRPCPGR